MTSNADDGKILEVLELFLLPDYNVVSATYLDLLQTHISTELQETDPSEYKYCKALKDWVLKALDVWSKGIVPCQTVTTFTLKLVGKIARNEFDFHYWYRENLYGRLRATLCLQEESLPASIKIAYTTMLCDLISHPNGRAWVIESGVWKDVVKFAHSNQTLYVTRESQKFIRTLLLYESQNVKVCEAIILEAAGPLMNSTFNPDIHPTLEESYLDQNKRLCSTLDLLMNILENSMFISLDSTVPIMLRELTNLEARIQALFEACINTRFFHHVHKLLLLLLFLKLKQGIKDDLVSIDKTVWDEFTRNHFCIFVLLSSKKLIREMVTTGKITLIYWQKMHKLRKFKSQDEYKFENQMMCMMLLPLMTCLKVGEMQHEYFDMFIEKLFQITCNRTHRFVYSVRDTIIKGDLLLEQNCKMSLQSLLDITDILDRDKAIIIFQAMCHALSNYMPNTQKNCSNCDSILPDNGTSQNLQRRTVVKTIFGSDPIVDNPILLSTLLDGLILLIEKYKMKWQECMETICILTLANKILDHSSVLPKLCVQALKLCKLAIQNFMPPNLALLVDPENFMDEMKPILFKRIHDPHWEVRDSVLEVLNTIAIISEDKYPAFQELLCASQFFQIAVDIIKDDGESYVRASALTFLSTTVRINKLWNKKLCQLELPKLAMRLLRDESEAVVRRESVVLLEELFVHRKWPKETIDDMTQTMAVAAILDLHWEVKVNAIKFWQQYIKARLTDQGMLDGSFPNVTFSKEHRKIVELTATEIKRRINKVLDELAQQSCLGVLLAALEDDSDFEVSKAAGELINSIKGILLKYKFEIPAREIPLSNMNLAKENSETEVEVNMKQDMSETCETSNSIIDSIVHADDVNLLASVYKNSMNMDGEIMKTETEKLEFVSSIGREDFINKILNSDIDAYIKEKDRWLKTYTNSLDSVIDDILIMYRQNDVNSMDCY